MNTTHNKKIDEDNHLYNHTSYVRDKIIILLVSVIFLMLRLGAIMPDVNNLFMDGFKIINLSKTFAVSYLVWMFLYFSFYQKYWALIEKEIIKSKQNIFKKKIAQKILRETHEKHGHDFDWFEINLLFLGPKLTFLISYSPMSHQEYEENERHSARTWNINLKSKNNRKYILPYLTEVYLRGPIVTAYIIPFSFPVIAWFFCMIGEWAGSLMTIITVLSSDLS